ncbi:hypothetical protein QWZ16_24500 [Vibrio ostreicida]|uniref:Uncharacterized protein n=1 Tax=Vibrio ostreicida TaxID=526588 RepID=A0ABT8C1B6_9VIBR|nr:hypothetical protein [Vibrio ostreicida]MDN3612729.1 hypothetical protein [Vibrio ostreicida]
MVVTSSSQDIYDYLIRQFFISLGLNAIRTTLVCSLLFLVFHHSINQRVMSIVRYLRQYYLDTTTRRYASSNSIGQSKKKTNSVGLLKK